NAMAESFFATLKTEFYYPRVWPTKTAAKLAVGNWIEGRYNRLRRHSAIGQISPVEFEMQHYNQTADLQQAALPRLHQTGSRPEWLASTPLMRHLRRTIKERRNAASSYKFAVERKMRH